MEQSFATRLRHAMADCLYQAELAKTRDDAKAIMRDWQILNDLYQTETAHHPEFA